MAHDAGPPAPEVQATAERLIAAALGYPEATLDHPWGHPALKVRGKAFVFLGAFADGLSFSAKLPGACRMNEEEGRAPLPHCFSKCPEASYFLPLLWLRQPQRVPEKLPTSSHEALMLPFVQPTGYGLGKSGWITARFAPGTPAPEDLLLAWMDESYRAIAPKKLVATLPSAA